MNKFTVVWGFDSHDVRVDFVQFEGEVNNNRIMDMAFKSAYNDYDQDDEPMSYHAFRQLPYDGYAIFDGHVNVSHHSFMV